MNEITFCCIIEQYDFFQFNASVKCAIRKITTIYYICLTNNISYYHMETFVEIIRYEIFIACQGLAWFRFDSLKFSHHVEYLSLEIAADMMWLKANWVITKDEEWCKIYVKRLCYLIEQAIATYKKHEIYWSIQKVIP